MRCTINGAIFWPTLYTCMFSDIVLLFCYHFVVNKRHFLPAIATTYCSSIVTIFFCLSFSLLLR